jgi:hypothetical protein
LDEKLLEEARHAGACLIDAEHDAEVARDEFHRTVRRLHLRGASLRELADALQLSHQRVHQIVEGAGGARRWRRREPTALELSCSFCARPQRKTRKLVAGPGVYICESCVERAASVITTGRSGQTELGPIMPVPASEKRGRCSFCGKHRHQVSGLATTLSNPQGKLNTDAAICCECLTLCREIHAEQLTG